MSPFTDVCLYFLTAVFYTFHCKNCTCLLSSRNKDISLSNLDAFDFSLPFLSYHTGLAHIIYQYNIDRSGDNGRHPSLPDLRGKAFSLSTLSTVYVMWVFDGCCLSVCRNSLIFLVS